MTAALGALTLAFDFGSTRATAAVAGEGRLLAARAAARAGRDADLLPLIESAIAAAGIPRHALTGIVALSGPGSFTGLRVACATALGLGSGLEIPAHGLSTLEALALASPASARRVLAVVDALRGEWFVQFFDRSGAGSPVSGGPRLLRAADCASPPALVAGEDPERFIAESGRADLEPFRPSSPAAAAALAAAGGILPGSPELLRRPLYLRPPATRRPLEPADRSE